MNIGVGLSQLARESADNPHAMALAYDAYRGWLLYQEGKTRTEGAIEKPGGWWYKAVREDYPPDPRNWLDPRRIMAAAGEMEWGKDPNAEFHLLQERLKLGRNEGIEVVKRVYRHLGLEEPAEVA